MKKLLLDGLLTGLLIAIGLLALTLGTARAADLPAAPPPAIFPAWVTGAVTASDASKGLLRYNGCVHGTNTPNCKTYPTKVKNYVERQAESLCGDKSFYQCIAKPFMDGLLGKRDATP